MNFVSEFYAMFLIGFYCYVKNCRTSKLFAGLVYPRCFILFYFIQSSTMYITQHLVIYYETSNIFELVLRPKKTFCSNFGIVHNIMYYLEES